MNKCDITIRNITWSDLCEIASDKFNILDFKLTPVQDPKHMFIGEYLTCDDYTSIHTTKHSHLIPLFNIQNRCDVYTKSSIGERYDGILIKQENENFKSYSYVSYDDKHKVICLFEKNELCNIPIYTFIGKAYDYIDNIELIDMDVRNQNDKPTEDDCIICDTISKKLFKCCKKVDKICEIYNQLDRLLNETIDFRYAIKIINLYNILAYKRHENDKSTLSPRIIELI